VAVPGDVTAAGFAERFTQAAVDSFGGLDIIVNNAGYTWDSVIQKMTDEQWDAILDVHLKAPFRVLRAAQPIISGFVNPGLLAAMEQLIPLGRAGTPADAAGAVYLLCIPESDYVSAQTLICGGGFFG
jgi:NAD(P)-dependent dehydrogenase (short-subunit alcohol dehydrogenase family)